MAKAINISPNKTYYKAEDKTIHAVFNDREYILTLEKPLNGKGNINECGSFFIGGIMMLSYIDQVEDMMAQQGYKGKIEIIKH